MGHEVKNLEGYFLSGGTQLALHKRLNWFHLTELKIKPQKTKLFSSVLSAFQNKSQKIFIGVQKYPAPKKVNFTMLSLI